MRPGEKGATGNLVTVDARLYGSSGIGTYLRNLLPLLAADARQRFHLLGLPGESGQVMEGLSGVTGDRLASPLYSPLEHLEIPLRTPRETAVWWTPHYNVPAFQRRPILATVHDVLHLAMPEMVGGRARAAYARALFAILRRRADTIVCDSAFTADELARHAGIRGGRVRVIHLGVEEAWQGGRDSERPLEAPYLVYVGNVKPHKNLGGLLEAFARLVPELPHRLVIVGRKEGFITGDRRVPEMARAFGERVLFTGEIGDDRLRSLVAHADALVHPSLYEGFGFPPLEAMAAGCPVVAADAGSIPEICGNAVQYCDPRDPADMASAILRVVREPALREELVGRGRERVKRFSWRRCADATREALEELLDR